jgi:hypothetical protein
MNPLGWLRQNQVAGLAFCAVGAIAGIIFAWIDSPIRQFASHVPGINAGDAFLRWLSNINVYWPWPLMGICFTGLLFYGVQLGRMNKEGATVSCWIREFRHCDSGERYRVASDARNLLSLRRQIAERQDDPEWLDEMIYRYDPILDLEMAGHCSLTIQLVR